MGIKSYTLTIIIALFSFSFTACSDEENMLWELVSNSNPENIEVVNNTSTSFENPSIIRVKANYKESNLVLRSVNHPIDFALIGPNDSYNNSDGAFSISKIDDNTLSINFEEDASEKPEYSDQITITNSDQKVVVCNTFLYITRTFGESQPTE